MYEMHHVSNILGMKILYSQHQKSFNSIDIQRNAIFKLEYKVESREKESRLSNNNNNKKRILWYM